MSRRIRRQLFLHALETKAVPNSTPHVLAASDFTQDWSNAALITANDDWSAVPSINGYRGDDLTTAIGTDPQTILADGSATPFEVIPNVANPNTNTSGGIGEFDTLANPVVGFQGSATADAPHLVLYLDATSVTSVKVSYNARDVDGSTDNTAQPVAVQYRVGGTGDYTNIPGGFIPDASTGPNLATLVTPVSVTLPAAADGQPLVEVRIMTTNATSSDEWIGIDDIVVTSTKAGINAPPSNNLPAPQVMEQNKSLTFNAANANAITVSDPDVAAGDLKVNLKVTDGKLSLGSLAGLAFTLGDGTDDVEMTFTGNLAAVNTALEGSVYTPTTGFVGPATLTIVSDDQGNTGTGGAKTDTDVLSISVTPPLYHVLAGGDLTQNWSNANLITSDNNWNFVPNIRGFTGAGLLNATTGADPQTVLDGKATAVQVFANVVNPDVTTSGGVAEFDALANPVVAVQGSGSSNAPHLVLYIDSTGTTGVRLKFNAIDVDGAADDTAQKIAVQWRSGDTGDFTNVPAGFIADATSAGVGKTTAVDVTLPAGATGLSQLQIRIMTVDAPGSDEWVGIDDIQVLQGVPNPNQPPMLVVSQGEYIDPDTSVTFSAATENAITVTDADILGGQYKINLSVTSGKFTLGSVNGLTFTKGDGTADPEMEFTGTEGDVNFALDNSVYTPNLGFTGTDTFTITANDQGNTGGPAQSDTDSFLIAINPVIEGTYHNLFGGALKQDWTTTTLITLNDDWSGVPSIIGFRGDRLAPVPGFNPQLITAYGRPPVIDVIANQTNPDTQTSGGVAEFDTLANPTVALQGSGTARAPHLTFYLNTLNVTDVKVAYDVRDIDGAADNSVQSVTAQYRIGTSGPFIDLPASLVADATEGPSLATLVSQVSFTLPAAAEGQAKVQLRVMTADAAGADEWVGIDNINISATPGAGVPAKVANVKVDDGTAQHSLVRSLTVTFDQKIDSPLDVSAFSLSRQGGGSVNLAANLDGTGTVATITFTGGDVDGTSLKNGRYNFAIDATKITTGGGTIQLDGDGNGTPGGNFTLNSAAAPAAPTNVWRLAGDVDGDNDVDTTDFAAFRIAFGGPTSLFDFDGDGDTDTSDFGTFRSNFGVSV